MKWSNKEKNNGWKLRFAFFPVSIGEVTVWLEFYYARFDGLYTNVREYEGCAERVGYPCDCFRHNKS